MKKRLKAAGLKKSLGKEHEFFKVFDNVSANAANVSFQILRKIAASGKCFTDGKFVKKCMLLAVSELCLRKDANVPRYQSLTLDRTKRGG